MKYKGVDILSDVEIFTVHIPSPNYFARQTDAELSRDPYANWTAEYIAQLRSQVELWKSLYAQARDNLNDLTTDAYNDGHAAGYKAGHEDAEPYI